MPSPNQTPKPIPVGGPAVLVAAVAVLIGGIGLIPFAADRMRSARTPPTNNLTGLSIAPSRQVPVPPADDTGVRAVSGQKVV